MGAIISPPDSASSGSDDEQGPEIRGRKHDKLDRLKDLREAVSHISQQRAPSPERQSREELQQDKSDNERSGPVHISFSMGDLARVGRKMGHVRSATEPHPALRKSADNSATVSEEETDEDLLKKPQMVRKKSGELVRPALRPPSRRRPSSMPGTPVFSKAVHFDSHLEHVRHFLQVDRPLAVSAGSSPIDSYESDTEYPFPGNGRPAVRTPPFEWEIVTSNFPHHSSTEAPAPVRLEKVWLSNDQKTLLGSVAVVNLAFHKSVVCRFTLDYWKTTSEVGADYSHEIRPKETPLGQDRFTFSIKLADTAHLESKTLFFCVRYTVNGQEYWDNNSGSNFQVDFRKKHLPQNGKNGFHGAAGRSANGLPRSNRRSTSSGNVPRPKSMPVSFDEFGGEDAKFIEDQPIHEYLGESDTRSSGLRFKSKSAGNLASDNMSNGFGSPSGVAFSNRYDFGASLNAAVQAAKEKELKDGLFMKPNVRSSKPTLSVSPMPPMPLMPPAAPALTQTAPGASSPNSTLSTSSYEELVSKYCFFGSKQSSPTLKDGTLGGRFDGTASGNGNVNGNANANANGDANTVVVLQTNTTSLGSPLARIHHAGPAAHHTLRLDGIRSNTQSPSPAITVPMGAFRSSSTSPKPTPRPSATVRSASPAFLTFDGTPSNDVSYHVQQQMMMNRFPWSADGHAATAILG